MLERGNLCSHNERQVSETQQTSCYSACNMSRGPFVLSDSFTEGNGKTPIHFASVFIKTGSPPSCVIWTPWRLCYFVRVAMD